MQCWDCCLFNDVGFASPFLEGGWEIQAAAGPATSALGGEGKRGWEKGTQNVAEQDNFKRPIKNIFLLLILLSSP